MDDKIKIVSWNVNGIRAILKKNFYNDVKTLNPDILCLQETKAHPSQIDDDLKQLGFKYEYWCSAQKKGYSGTVIFSKYEPLNIFLGFGEDTCDEEGRIITAEFEKFYLITVYTPNAQPKLARIEFRKKWDIDFKEYISKLNQKKPVIFCGDLNVAHNEIDLKNPAANKHNPGFSEPERNGFTEILNAGFIDTYRSFYPDKIKYSWWSYRFSARDKNIGWRIDYFCVSKSIINAIENPEIHNEVFGSDHCPVSIELNLKKVI